MYNEGGFLSDGSYASLDRGTVAFDPNGIRFITPSTPIGWSTIQSPRLSNGTYQINIRLQSTRSFPTYGIFALDTARIIPAGSLENPVLPISITPPNPNEPPIFTFAGGNSGAWFDPPTASAFKYQMTSNSLFTGILDFPTGFDGLFAVKANGVDLGSFGPGQPVDFTSFPGGGVSAFTVSGISPLADPANPLAFPLKLAFNTATADFTMQAVSAVPETAALSLLAVATLIGGSLQWRRRIACGLGTRGFCGPPS